jgi:hypothetical protein
MLAKNSMDDTARACLLDFDRASREWRRVRLGPAQPQRVALGAAKWHSRVAVESVMS